MASGEALPLVKSGGLADVVGALPPHLAGLGARVLVAIPFYRSILRSPLARKTLIPFMAVRVGPHVRRVTIYSARISPGVDALLVRHNPSFDREHLYGTARGAYEDNGRRFSLFCHAVAAIVPLLAEKIDVVHCHDWQSALIPLLLRGRVPSVFTIHNLGYQGNFPRRELADMGLPDSLFTPDGLEFHGQVNFMKAGIIWSDAITTVSPRYAAEITRPEMGFGLDGLIRAQAGKLSGILNGADYSQWSPAVDPNLAARYHMANLDGKATCRRALLDELGLPASPAPVVAMIGRLVWQKGVDLVLGALPALMERDLVLAILGTGDEEYESALRSAAARFPRLRLLHGFDEGLAHRLIAGADILLMPSRYEPCGLTQMYALKYGTIPVVRRTGGLADTIEPFNAARLTGTGFAFDGESPEALVHETDRALDAFGSRSSWQHLMVNAMSADFSWDRSAAEYLDLYRRLSGRPGTSTREDAS
jgi:starch synthase